VFHAALDAVEGAALSALVAGRPFGEICAVVGEHVAAEAAPAEAAGLLARWIEDALLAAHRA
jgi:hypothetical protein